MSSNPRKRQKKMERKNAKRKAKKHAIAKRDNAGLPQRLAAAARFPVLHCTVSEAFFHEGMGQVMLSREMPGGMVAFATFLVDRYCLGIKDTFGDIIHRSDYDERIIGEMMARAPIRTIAPADALKLLHQAADYGRSIGFSPHADYTRFLVLFGDIEPSPTATFEFGDNGKPHFIAGPYDSPARCRQVMTILEHHCGPRGYHFTIPFSEDEFGEEDMPELPGTWDDEGDDEDDED